MIGQRSIGTMSDEGRHVVSNPEPQLEESQEHAYPKIIIESPDGPPQDPSFDSNSSIDLRFRVTLAHSFKDSLSILPPRQPYLSHLGDRAQESATSRYTQVPQAPLVAVCVSTQSLHRGLHYNSLAIESTRITGSSPVPLCSLRTIVSDDV